MSTSVEKAGPTWDIFLVHTHEDADRAANLLARVGAGYRVFLDRASLTDGAAWDTAIPDALRSSLVIAVLLSPAFARAHYARDEVIRAVALARTNPPKCLTVPVYLDGRPSREEKIPYGLAPFQSLDATEPGGLGYVASRLRGMVDELRAGRPGGPPPPPLPRASLPVNDLHRYPPWPRVEPEEVEPCLIRAIAEVVKPMHALEVVAQANKARRKADPGDPTVTTISTVEVVPPSSSAPLDFWTEVFREARLNGPRMLAALVMAVNPNHFPAEAKQARHDLLEFLANLPAEDTDPPLPLSRADA